MAHSDSRKTLGDWNLTTEEFFATKLLNEEGCDLSIKSSLDGLMRSFANSKSKPPYTAEEAAAFIEAQRRKRVREQQNKFNDDMAAHRAYQQSGQRSRGRKGANPPTRPNTRVVYQDVEIASKNRKQLRAEGVLSRILPPLSNILLPQTIPPLALSPQALPPQTVLPQALPPQTLPTQTLPTQTLPPLGKILPPQTLPPGTLPPQTLPSQTAQRGTTSAKTPSARKLADFARNRNATWELDTAPLAQYQEPHVPPAHSEQAPKGQQTQQEQQAPYAPSRRTSKSQQIKQKQQASQLLSEWHGKGTKDDPALLGRKIAPRPTRSRRSASPRSPVTLGMGSMSLYPTAESSSRSGPDAGHP